MFRYIFCLLTIAAIFHVNNIQAQTTVPEVEKDTLSAAQVLDTLYIYEVEDLLEPNKVLHAEPLYIDLIRDLGARKGEKEWNIGMGMTDRLSHDEFEGLIEYEFAPINRLGLEVEVPFKIFSKNPGDNRGEPTPSNRIESLKLAAQWTFLVSEKAKTSLALGYIHEFELTDLRTINARNFYKGNLYDPFFVAAKRWGNNFHTLIYTGPTWLQEFDKGWQFSYQHHTNFHYMISGTRNFIGVEINKSWENGEFEMVMRPQMRVGLAENLLIGIVGGIPLNREQQRLSSFVRVIYEPGHRHLPNYKAKTPSRASRQQHMARRR